MAIIRIIKSRDFFTKFLSKKQLPIFTAKQSKHDEEEGLRYPYTDLSRMQTI